jgi:hypothetical protein
VSDDEEGLKEPTYDILIEEGWIPQPLTMMIVKQLPNGDVHAENSNGEMIIVDWENKRVSTFLDDDTQWVKGRLPPGVSPWEVIGYHFGMTNGQFMDRTRNEQTN